jgi:hypothetical protein
MGANPALRKFLLAGILVAARGIPAAIAAPVTYDISFTDRQGIAPDAGAFRYDASTETFSNVGNLPCLKGRTGGASMGTPRVNPTTTLLPSGAVLIVGGADGATPLKTAELFDALTGGLY